MAGAPVILSAEDLVRRHEGREVVGGVSLTLAAGEAVALVGPSGSGKTTLLQMLGLLDRPSAGRVLVDGHDVWRLVPGQRAVIRLERIGFIFQRSNLLPNLDVRDNVLLPAWRLRGDRRAAGDLADALLARLRLASRAGAPAHVLSIGEAQRVAIARALVNSPALVLADEPTGSLDSAAASAVLEALEEVRARGAALLLVTHDAGLARRMPRVLTLEDGKLRG
jgi:putative ABC transport system ATP-binding protein